MKKEKNKLIPGVTFFVSLVTQLRKSDKPIPENTLLNSEEKRVFLSRIIPHGLRKR